MGHFFNKNEQHLDDYSDEPDTPRRDYILVRKLSETLGFTIEVINNRLYVELKRWNEWFLHATNEFIILPIQNIMELSKHFEDGVEIEKFNDSNLDLMIMRQGNRYKFLSSGGSILISDEEFEELAPFFPVIRFIDINRGNSNVQMVKELSVCKLSVKVEHRMQDIEYSGDFGTFLEEFYQSNFWTMFGTQTHIAKVLAVPNCVSFDYAGEKELLQDGRLKEYVLTGWRSWEPIFYDIAQYI